MINLTADLLSALHDVSRHDVDYYPGLVGGHPEGYGWHDGGDVPPVEQDALHILEVAHLIAPVPARVGCEIGCEVVLTSAGLQALSESRQDGAL